MEEIRGKLRGSEDPLHLFNEKAEPLRLVYTFPVKDLSRESDMWRTLLTPLASLHDPYLEGKKEANCFHSIWCPLAVHLFFTMTVLETFLKYKICMGKFSVWKPQKEFK